MGHHFEFELSFAAAAEIVKDGVKTGYYFAKTWVLVYFMCCEKTDLLMKAMSVVLACDLLSRLCHRVSEDLERAETREQLWREREESRERQEKQRQRWEEEEDRAKSPPRSTTTATTATTTVTPTPPTISTANKNSERRMAAAVCNCQAGNSGLVSLPVAIVKKFA